MQNKHIAAGFLLTFILSQFWVLGSQDSTKLSVKYSGGYSKSAQTVIQGDPKKEPGPGNAQNNSQTTKETSPSNSTLGKKTSKHKK